MGLGHAGPRSFFGMKPANGYTCYTPENWHGTWKSPYFQRNTHLPNSSSLSLTSRPWKLMVERWSFSLWGKRAFFRGKLSVLGRVNHWNPCNPCFPNKLSKWRPEDVRCQFSELEARTWYKDGTLRIVRNGVMGGWHRTWSQHLSF